MKNKKGNAKRGACSIGNCGKDILGNRKSDQKIVEIKIQSLTIRACKKCASYIAEAL